MRLADAVAEADRVLGAGLQELTEDSRLSVLPPEEVDQWDLPQDGRKVLRTYGLPPIEEKDDPQDVVRRCQTGAQPELEYRGIRYYALGLLDPHHPTRVGVRAGSGEVFAVPSSDTEIPASMRDRFPDGLAPRLLNSGVPQFVEFSWRWYRLIPIFAHLVDQESHAEQVYLDMLRSDPVSIPRDEVRNFYDNFRADVKSLGEHVLSAFAHIDPAAATHADSYWRREILDWS
ncbi:MAG TPA: SUKH-4 family immunity protein [Thermomonospora sp.]|nr:SUKH-4 family immunity protein [Thermomonospora sp.]